MKKIVGFLILLVSIINGCSCKSEDVKSTFIISSYIKSYLDKEMTKYTYSEPFGAYVRIVGYDESRLNNVETKFNELVEKYHGLLDRNYYYSDREGNIINNLRVINDSYGTGDVISVDEILIKALKDGVKYTKMSNGNFNIISGSIVDVWDERFTSSDINIRNVDPNAEDIEEAMKCVANVNDIDEILVIDELNNSII